MWFGGLLLALHQKSKWHFIVHYARNTHVPIEPNYYYYYYYLIDV